MRVIIMCKAPVAGRVKTRLMRAYSAEEAATIHAAMAGAVIERARRLFDDVWLAADDPEHPFFQQTGLPLRRQVGGDLGRRMAAEVRHAFRDGAGAVMLLGTDSPHMADSRLLAAARFVERFDVVVGPVEDGGYDLIAMRAPHTSLFRGVAWSTEKVLSQTSAIAERHQLSLRLLPESFDVDTPAMLERACQAGWSLPERIRAGAAR
jgi:hypothetical protein